MIAPKYPLTQFITIHIEWHGPFLISDLLKGDKRIFNRIGLYQIYGDHPINGSDNLLYIGHTTNSFKKRFQEHYDGWLREESSVHHIYLGAIWKHEEFGPETELLFIKEAEKLLIYYCAPPYNSRLIYDINQGDVFKDENMMVINLWQKHRLPYEVSTLWYYSDCWDSKRELLKLEKESDEKMPGK